MPVCQITYICFLRSYRFSEHPFQIFMITCSAQFVCCISPGLVAWYYLWFLIRRKGVIRNVSRTWTTFHNLFRRKHDSRFFWLYWLKRGIQFLYSDRTWNQYSFFPSWAPVLICLRINTGWIRTVRGGGNRNLPRAAPTFPGLLLKKAEMTWRKY